MVLNPYSLPEAYDFDTILRELSWLSSTKPIWQSTQFIDDSFGRIYASDIKLAARDLQQTWSWHGVPSRLGRRFEELITAYFEHTPSVQILGHGIPIYRDKTSIGEIDLILNVENKIIHLEVALKFYAGIKNDQMFGWVGPSCKDHFLQKKRHVLNHQLPIIDTPECLTRLNELRIERPNQSIGLIFGYLMQPWDCQIPLDPDMIKTSHAYWCTHKKFHNAARKLTRPYGSAYGWKYLPRAQWTAPHVATARLPLLATTKPPEQADCYVLMPKYQSDVEKLRLFVFPDDFPGRAARTLDNICRR